MRRIYLGTIMVYGIAILLFVFIMTEWCKRIAARNVIETEKEVFLDVPVECPPPKAIESIIDSVDYIPKHWLDCKKNTEDNTWKQSTDDRIAGEML